jgi:hypothetical protein
VLTHEQIERLVKEAIQEDGKEKALPYTGHNARHS